MDQEGTIKENIVKNEDNKRVDFSNINRKQLKKIFSSAEAKRRTKKLWDKALSNLNESKTSKKYEILDSDVIELNDSNDFSHQPILRTGRLQNKETKKKIKTSSNLKKTVPELKSVFIPSTSSASESNQVLIATDIESGVEEGIYSTVIKEEAALLKNSKDVKDKCCPLCHNELKDICLKDHMISCMEQNFKRNNNESDGNDPFSETELTSCHICGKNIRYLSSTKQTQHINNCLDQIEDNEKQKEHENQLQKARSAILGCPMCEQKFRSASSRTTHLKKCALNNKMTVEQVKNLAKQQEEERRNQLDAGILPADLRAANSKGTKGKLKARKQTCRENEDTELAMALSSSLTDARKGAEAAKQRNLHLAGTSKSGQGGKKSKKVESTSLLLNLPREEASERILKRVTDLIFNVSPPEGSISQTPEFKRKIDSPSVDSDLHNHLWKKTSLSSPGINSPSSEQGQPQQQPLPSSPTSSHPYQISSHSRPSYYIPTLMPPITINEAPPGSKLKRLSAIPGRKRSIGHQCREANVPASPPSGKVSTETAADSSLSEQENQSQTVALLAELATENDEDDENFSLSSYSHKPCQMSSSPQNLISTSMVEKVSEKGVASPQISLHQCELEELSASFLSLVDCPEHSDVKISTQDGVLIPAHKIVLFARCPRLFEADNEGIINLSDYQKESVLSVLRFIYGGQVSLIHDGLEDVIKLCKKLCLTALLERAQKRFNCMVELQSLEKDIDQVCPVNIISLKECKEQIVAGSGDHIGSDSQSANIERKIMEGCNGLIINKPQLLTGDTDCMEKTNEETEYTDQNMRDIDQDMEDRDLLNLNIEEQQIRNTDFLQRHRKEDDTNGFEMSEESQMWDNLGMKKNFTDDGFDKSPEILQIVESNDCNDQSPEIHQIVESNDCNDQSPEIHQTVESNDCNDQSPEIHQTVESNDCNDQSPEIHQTVESNDCNDQSPEIHQIVESNDCNDQSPEIHQTVESNDCSGNEAGTNTTAMLVCAKQDVSTEILYKSLFETPLTKSTQLKYSSTKVSKREFKNLVDKAVGGELTEEERVRLAIKIELDDNLIQTNEPYYIPSVLEDSAPVNPSELEITNFFIAPSRFKSKKRASNDVIKKRPKSSLNVSGAHLQTLNMRQNEITHKDALNCKARNEVGIPLKESVKQSLTQDRNFFVNPHSMLMPRKTYTYERDDFVNEKADTQIESKLSTSCVSDTLFSSDDDLFADEVMETSKENDKKQTNCGSIPVSRQLNSDARTSSDSRAVISNSVFPKKLFGNSSVTSATSTEQSSQKVNNTEDVQILDSEAMQKEIANAITEEFLSIRGQKHLSQSEDNESDREICTLKQASKNFNSMVTECLRNSSENIICAESIPASDTHQVPEIFLEQQIPGDHTLKTEEIVLLNDSCSKEKNQHNKEESRIISLDTTPVKNQTGSPNPSFSSSSKKKTQRGLTQVRNRGVSAPVVPCLMSSQIAGCSGSGYVEKRHINMKELKDPVSVSSSDESPLNTISGRSLNQQQQCRRTLNFDTTSAHSPVMVDKISSSHVDTPSSEIDKISSSPIIKRAIKQTVGRESVQTISHTETYMDSLIECFARKVGHTPSSVQAEKSCGSVTLVKISGNSISDLKTAPDSSPLSESSIIKEQSCSHSTSTKHNSSTSKVTITSAKSSTFKSEPTTMPTVAVLHHTKNNNSPPQLPLKRKITMEYSPVIKKSKGPSACFETAMMVSSPGVDKSQTVNKVLSFNKSEGLSGTNNIMTIDNTQTSSSDGSNINILSKKSLEHSELPCERTYEPPLPLRERLGLGSTTALGSSSQQPENIARNHLNGDVVVKNKTLPFNSVAENEETTTKPSMANQVKNMQSLWKHPKAQKRLGNSIVEKAVGVTEPTTPKVGQVLSKGKSTWKEPSPFTPMPHYDEMNTPQLKTAADKIGVRHIGKKRMRMFLKDVYEQTHQYETDSDYEPTPVKPKCFDSFLPQTRLGNPSHLVNDSSSAVESDTENDPFKHNAGSHGNGSNQVLTSIANLVPDASSLTDFTSDYKEDDDDDPLKCSQDSSNSDGPDLPEESILQGWPEEEEDVVSTQLTQTSAASLMDRLMEFFTQTKDIYEKILMYEPLELDVLKKKIADAGIKIAMAKLMDFLDEQCITFSMKNMSSRNMRQQQKGRTKAKKSPEKHKRKNAGNKL